MTYPIKLQLTPNTLTVNQPYNIFLCIWRVIMSHFAIFMQIFHDAVNPKNNKNQPLSEIKFKVCRRAFAIIIFS